MAGALKRPASASSGAKPQRSRGGIATPSECPAVLTTGIEAVVETAFADVNANENSLQLLHAHCEWLAEYVAAKFVSIRDGKIQGGSCSTEQKDKLATRKRLHVKSAETTSGSIPAPVEKVKTSKRVAAGEKKPRKKRTCTDTFDVKALYADLEPLMDSRKIIKIDWTGLSYGDRKCTLGLKDYAAILRVWLRHVPSGYPPQVLCRDLVIIQMEKYPDLFNFPSEYADVDTDGRAHKVADNWRVMLRHVVAMKAATEVCSFPEVTELIGMVGGPTYKETCASAMQGPSVVPHQQAAEDVASHQKVAADSVSQPAAPDDDEQMSLEELENFQQACGTPGGEQDDLKGGDNAASSANEEPLCTWVDCQCAECGGIPIEVDTASEEVPSPSSVIAEAAMPVNPKKGGQRQQVDATKESHDRMREEKAPKKKGKNATAAGEVQPKVKATGKTKPKASRGDDDSIIVCPLSKHKGKSPLRCYIKDKNQLFILSVSSKATESYETVTDEVMESIEGGDIRTKGEARLALRKLLISYKTLPV